MFGINNFSESIIKFGSDFSFSQIGKAAAFGSAMVLIGMVTVFTVLCVLWGCLTLFNLIFESIAQKKKTKTDSPLESTSIPTRQSVSEDEIVAVIAAAIAMAESECSDTKFRVVSFKRK